MKNSKEIKEKIIKFQDINTFMCYEDEVILCGKALSTNWEEEEVQIRMNMHEVLEWIDKKYIKEKYIEYVKKIVD